MKNTKQQDQVGPEPTIVDCPGSLGPMTSGLFRRRIACAYAPATGVALIRADSVMIDLESNGLTIDDIRKQAKRRSTWSVPHGHYKAVRF